MLLSPLAALVWGFSAGEITPAPQPETSAEAQKPLRSGDYTQTRTLKDKELHRATHVQVCAFVVKIVFYMHLIKTTGALILHPTFRNEKK